jgi:accessory colonization factor AcfC
MASNEYHPMTAKFVIHLFRSSFLLLGLLCLIVAYGCAKDKDPTEKAVRLILLPDKTQFYHMHHLEEALNQATGMHVKIGMDFSNTLELPHSGITVEELLKNYPDLSAGVIIAGFRRQLDKFREKGLVNENYSAFAMYRMLCIVVPKGNPKNIKGLADLLRPGMRLGIADADDLGAGRLTRAMLKRQKILDAYLKNVVLVHEDALVNYSKHFGEDRLDAAITWADMAKNWSKSWDTVEIAPKEAMYQMLFDVASESVGKSKNARRFLDSMQSRKAAKVLHGSGFGLMSDPRPEQFFKSGSEAAE